MAARESSLMPTIKCSTCAKDIEIMEMGDHVCGKEPPKEEVGFSASLLGRFQDVVNKTMRSDRLGQDNPAVEAGEPAKEKGSRYQGLAELDRKTSLKEKRSSPASTSREWPSLSLLKTVRSGSGRSDDILSPSSASDYGSTVSTTSDRPQRQRRNMNDDGESMYASSLGRQGPSGGGFLQRVNTMATGPFDAGRRREFSPSANESRAESRPGTSGSNLSQLSSGTSGGNDAKQKQSKMPKNKIYDGFGPPPDQKLEDPDRSQFGLSRSATAPVADPAMGRLRGPTRAPSAPGNGDWNLPSRGDSLSGRRGPKSNIADKLGIGNPFETSRDSVSSGDMGSTFSYPSLASSRTSYRTSPSRSRLGSRGGASDMGASDRFKLTADKLKSLSSSPQMSDALSSEEFKSGDAYSTGCDPFGWNYDDRVQDSKLRDNEDDRSASRRGRQQTPAREQDWHAEGTTPGRRRPTADSRSRSRGRPTPSRGDCRSCGEAITGKSVSSADGRLTGRYHKACFVCTTCRKPFPTAVFYVLDDRPYCDIHYHTLNGSLCGSCEEGIEGQYVEDEKMRKHHVVCFCCHDCDISLSDGYFEIKGRNYCEKHARKRFQRMYPSDSPSREMQSPAASLSLSSSSSPIRLPRTQASLSPSPMDRWMSQVNDPSARPGQNFRPLARAATFQVPNGNGSTTPGRQGAPPPLSQPNYGSGQSKLPTFMAGFKPAAPLPGPPPPGGPPPNPGLRRAQTAGPGAPQMSGAPILNRNALPKAPPGQKRPAPSFGNDSVGLPNGPGRKPATALAKAPSMMRKRITRLGAFPNQRQA